MTDTRPIKEITINNTVGLPNNSTIQELFNADRSFSFVVGNVPANQVLFSKGHESDPSQGSWAIISENHHLKIVLHEKNDTNSLVFKSNQPILNTRIRPFITINWFNSLKNIELFLESLSCSFSLDTSEAHYRTTTASFTGLRVTTDDLIVGRGVTIPNQNFDLFYVLGEKTLSQIEVNQYYQSEKDNRVLPELGKFVFTSNRAGAGYFDVYTSDEEGQDVNLLYSFGNANSFNPQWDFDGNSITLSSNNYVIQRSSEGVDLFSRYSQDALAPSAIASHTKNEDYLFYNQYGAIYKLQRSNNANISMALVRGYAHIKSYSPIENNEILLIMGESDNVTFPLYLVRYNYVTNLYQYIYNTPYITGILGKITNARYSKDGTKIAFNTYHNESGTDYRVYMCNSDGSNLQMLYSSDYAGQRIEFCSFSPDGTKILISKKVSGIGYTNKFHLFVLDLNTNLETQITFGNHDNYQADWKA